MNQQLYSQALAIMREALIADKSILVKCLMRL